MVVQHTDLDLDDLERKARAASPGAWWRCTCCSMLHRDDGATDGARDCTAQARAVKNRSAATADYIAATTPAVALELIELVRRAEAPIAQLEHRGRRRIVFTARVRVTDARSAYHGHT